MRAKLTLPVVMILLSAMMTVGLWAQSFEAPALVDSLGQTDGPLVRALCRRTGVDLLASEVATSESIGEAGTLLIAVGASDWSLDRIGVTPEQERARGAAMISSAQAQGVPILGLHIGGAARRGAASDPLCELVARNADALIVRAEGDADGLFSRIARERGIPLTIANSDDDVIAALRAAFE